MGLFDALFQKTKNAASTIAKELSGYDLNTKEGIESIPNKQQLLKSFNNGTFADTILAKLQKKATEYKKENNIEMFLLCLEKSYMIMKESDYFYSPYADRYVSFLKKYRYFDKARKIQKEIDARDLSFDTISELDMAIKNAQILKTDLLEADFPKPTDSRTAMYRGRIFSISGKDKRFPKLPDDISETELTFGPFIFEVSEPLYCKPGKEIEFSNKPFKDTRSSKERAEYNEMVQKMQESENNSIDYDWVWENLPDIAPKSLSGYVRMKNSNSTNYQKLKKAAEEKGYILK